MSLDKWFFKTYKPGAYNCLHFATDVWADITGIDIRERLQGLLQGALAERKLLREHAKAFRALPAPADPCLVLFQNGRSTPHVGVYVRGRVLHIQDRAGVQYMPLRVASVGFADTIFFVPV